MFDLLRDLLSIDQYAMITVVSVSALGGFIMKQMVDSRMLVALFVPAFLLGGLIALFVFNRYDIVLTPDKEANVVVVTSLGMMASLLVMIVLLRAAHAIGGSLGPRPD